jgi:hypothetical protein
MKLVFLAVFLILATSQVTKRYTYQHWRTLRGGAHVYVAIKWPQTPTPQDDILDTSGSPYWYTLLSGIINPTTIGPAAREEVYPGGPLEPLQAIITDKLMLPGDTKPIPILVQGMDTSTVHIEITLIVTNTAPTVSQVVPLSTHWRSPASIDILALAFDADSDPLYIGGPTSYNPLGCGSASVVSNMLVFQASNFKGNCSFDYWASDSVSNSPHLIATVTSTNTAPTTTLVNANVLRTVTNYAVDVLAAATDADLDPLSIKAITSITPSGCAIGTNVTSGQLVVDSFAGTSSTCVVAYTVTDTVDDVSGSVTFTFIVRNWSLTPIRVSTHWRSSKLTVNPNNSNVQLQFKAFGTQTCANVEYDPTNKVIVVTSFNTITEDCVIPYTTIYQSDLSRYSLAWIKDTTI